MHMWKHAACQATYNIDDILSERRRSHIRSTWKVDDIPVHCVCTSHKLEQR